MKKWIHAKRVKISHAKNLINQLGMFLTPNTNKIFIKLRQVFIKALIPNHFNPKYYIQIEIDVLGYAISEIFN